MAVMAASEGPITLFARLCRTQGQMTIFFLVKAVLLLQMATEHWNFNVRIIEGAWEISSCVIISFKVEASSLDNSDVLDRVNP